MSSLRLADEVASALAAGWPVVALESSLIAHGLPPPHNLETALAAERAVREAGAVPATIAVDAGWLVVGADRALLERLAAPEAGAAKAATRDLAASLARRMLAGTTVSATVRIAHAAGIAILATGGIGGVHRGAAASFDVSSDIVELAATPVAVVCSGAKSILDLPATLERLESSGIPVVGLGTGELPAFYAAASGLPLPHRVETPAEAAALVKLHFGLGGASGILFCQPPPEDVRLEAPEIDRLVDEAVAAAAAAGVSGGALTPWLLARLAERSEGRTLATNIGLVVNNAGTAAAIAVALAGRTAPSPPRP